MKEQSSVECVNNIEVLNGDIQTIESLIHTIRGKQVLVDRDLAMLYKVETRVLNQAIKRNIERFPERFRFQLSKEEMAELVTNCDRFSLLKHSSVCPYVFTEQGVAMLSTVLWMLLLLCVISWEPTPNYSNGWRPSNIISWK